MTDWSAQQEIDRNFEAFRERLDELVASDAGKFVVMHDRRVIEMFDTFADAVRFGRSVYGWGKFSIQEVTTRQVTQGFRTNAVPYRAD